MKVVHQITNNEEDEGDGRNEKAQKNQIRNMKISIAASLRTAQYVWMRLKGVARRSDDNAAYKPIEEAEIYDVRHEISETNAKTPQLRRLSESYTTGVPTKRTNKEKLHELNNELNYATEPMLDKPKEPMEIASHSSDSFEVRRNVK